MSREFGIYPENIIPKQWWGARATIINGRLDVLQDRQNYERGETVSDADKKAFFNWLSNEMDAALRKEVKAGHFQVWEDVFAFNSDDGRFHCEATPKNSGGGYLYIGVWQV